MQIDVQDFLKVAEKAGAICFFDLEMTGLSADYGTILIGSVKEYGKSPKTFVVDTPGDDRDVAIAVRNELNKYMTWVSYNGKMFDIKFLNTRLLIHGEEQAIRRHHLDMYWQVKYHTRTSRKSQAHVLNTLDAVEEKMTVSPKMWAEIMKNPAKNLLKLKDRCESDVIGLEELYDKMKHLIINLNVTR